MPSVDHRSVFSWVYCLHASSEVQEPPLVHASVSHLSSGAAFHLCVATRYSTVFEYSTHAINRNQAPAPAFDSEPRTRKCAQSSIIPPTWTPLTQGSPWATTERTFVCIQRPQPERERTLVSINGERRKRIVDSSVRKSGDSKSAVVGGHLLHRMSARRRGKEHRAQA